VVLLVTRKYLDGCTVSVYQRNDGSFACRTTGIRGYGGELIERRLREGEVGSVGLGVRMVCR